MFVNLKLKAKLLSAFLAVGIVPFTILAVIALNRADNALSKQAFDQLVSVRDIKKFQIQRYLQTIADQAVTLSGDRMIMEAMSRLKIV